MKYVISYLSVFILIIFAAACSDISDEIASPQEVSIHEEGITTSSSANFHGKILTDDGLKNCQQCHAANFEGGVAEVSCVDCHNTIGIHKDGIINPASENFHSKYLLNTGTSFLECRQCHGEGFSGGLAATTCVDCHGTIGVHKDNIVSPASNNFHGKYFGVNDIKMNQCGQCHGESLTGGLIATSCEQCHNTIGVHKDGIKNPSSDNFHAKFLFNNEFAMNECTQCHGDSYEGGVSSPTCQNCHNGVAVHKQGIFNPGSDNFHGKFIANQNWKLSECSQCHGDNYAGGLMAPTCNTCHSQQEGPEACNTCHGNFSNPQIIVPDKGAHEKHLFPTNLTVLYAECMLCHKVPSDFDSDGHIDQTPGAEVILTGFAGSSATYNNNTSTCNNTYCHGGFEFLKSESSFQFAYTADKMEGNNFNPDWNKLDGSQAACGTCHGLPPVGHVAASLETCVNCHSGVVDANGNIIDETKHLNGQKNVFGN